MSNPDKHEHEWVKGTKTVPLHNYVTERGSIVKDLISGKDLLKVWKCKCGEIRAYDLQRSKI